MNTRVIDEYEDIDISFKSIYLFAYRKPPAISPPEYNPPPVYKPTTCTNAHIIPNISHSKYKPFQI
jgi:hypothetical protein